MKRALPLLLLLTSCAPQVDRPLPAGDTQRPDIVLLSIDTLRADHLGLYGHDRDTSPFLDEMASRGTVFDQAWSPAPWTLPAHATMLSAHMPNEHGAIDQEHSISPDVPMLPEALIAAGYRNAAVVTAPFVAARYGFDRGFQHFVDLSDTEGKFELSDVADAEEVFEEALRWTEGQESGRPAFLFLHVYDVHYPYDPPAPWNEHFGRAATTRELSYENYFHYLRRPLDDARMALQREQYDEEIAYVDAMLRDFHRTWVASRPNTIFVVVSDHGEEFGERGSWGHGHTLTPEQLQVPWIVWGPGIRTQRVEARVGLEDLAPTLAELGGTAFGPFSGRSRAALFDRSNEAGPAGALVASTSRRNTLQVRWHFPRRTLDPDRALDLILDLRKPDVSLFDLTHDPRATKDIDTQDPVLLRSAWAAAMRDSSAQWEVRSNGLVSTDGVVLLFGGAPVSQPIQLSAGTRFALWPADAVLHWKHLEESAGPWQRVGGALPVESDPIVFLGESRASGAASLSEEDEEKLRALGYAH
jgi:arylsulfatase A-like enzyme